MRLSPFHLLLCSGFECFGPWLNFYRGCRGDLRLFSGFRFCSQSFFCYLRHTGERWAGAITAALFLREFVGQVPWIHCDIAGPALSDKAAGTVPKGGTGHPVLTFLRLVEHAAARQV